MKKIALAFVYTALTFGANAAWADPSEDILLLRDGDMKKLVVHENPQSTSTAAFMLADDKGEATLEDWRGKYVLLNFWATWCAPCRTEMPHLSALQEEFGGPEFEVVTLATGRNSAEGIKRFFEEIGVGNLPRHQDPRKALASQMGVAAIPVTVLIDREGREIARLQGDADWHSESARAIIGTLIGADGGG